MKQIKCIKCKGDMPELRLTKYGYNFCVNCSTVNTKRGVSIMKGSGEDTWVETEIMEEETYQTHFNPEGRYEITFGIEEEE